MNRFLDHTWKPALGCTEPASIAFAASLAASQGCGDVKAVSLRCDPRVFKNSYAVGIPNSGGKTGILWAVAIGALLPDSSLELECFKQTNDEILMKAARLLELNVVQVDSIADRNNLYIDCQVIKTDAVGRVVIEGTHTNIVTIEKNGISQKQTNRETTEKSEAPSDSALKGLSFSRMISLAQSISDTDRERIRDGYTRNLAIAEDGMSKIGQRLPGFDRSDPVDKISQLVYSGVYARMNGSSLVVMSAAGSGNKGIACSLPVVLHGREIGAEQKKIEEATALSIILTNVTTAYLGTLSAICGCANASGIGLAAGLVYLHGGGEKEVSHAVSNMVGSISGIICDGAKIGCALKAITAVDAAFRSASLAMGGICIPVSDGIVGSNGKQSLENLGRIANLGMIGVDEEILQIMKAKLNSQPSPQQPGQRS